jgi:hypothetical protein
MVEAVDETWDDFQIEPAELLDGGDHVVSFFSSRGIEPATSAPAEWIQA